MTTQLTRRELLLVGAASACAGACFGCAGGVAAPPPAPTCDEASTGPGIGYCLVASRVLRITGAARLVPGQIKLAALDDNSAALVGRDSRGLYARSAICTHACCVVGICTVTECAAVEPSPSPCGATAAISVSTVGAALLCPCHGSTFDATGSVITGPATRSLPALDVKLDGADALVDLATPADPQKRVSS